VIPPPFSPLLRSPLSFRSSSFYVNPVVCFFEFIPFLHFLPGPNFFSRRNDHAILGAFAFFPGAYSLPCRICCKVTVLPTPHFCDPCCPFSPLRIWSPNGEGGFPRFSGPLFPSPICKGDGGFPLSFSSHTFTSFLCLSLAGSMVLDSPKFFIKRLPVQPGSPFKPLPLHRLSLSVHPRHRSLHGNPPLCAFLFVFRSECCHGPLFLFLLFFVCS